MEMEKDVIRVVRMGRNFERKALYKSVNDDREFIIENEKLVQVKDSKRLGTWSYPFQVEKKQK